MWSAKPDERVRLKLESSDGSVKTLERMCSAEKTLGAMDALAKGLTRK